MLCCVVLCYEVLSCLVLSCRLSDLLDGPAVVRTWHHRIVFAEDLVRKRQRPHCYVMSVDVSGRIADPGEAKSQGSRVKGQGSRVKRKGYALVLACCTLSGLMPGFLHSNFHDALRMTHDA